LEHLIMLRSIQLNGERKSFSGIALRVFRWR
jgi:hypothetical protein